MIRLLSRVRRWFAWRAIAAEIEREKARARVQIERSKRQKSSSLFN